ncbi:DPP IV N-terminal domain-containing protein [Porticoccaceae bacterium]|nr:DPP IV N-terminal domain-containing protein [Porticoccaceae bacterium]
MNHQQERHSADNGIMEERYQRAQAFIQGYTPKNLIQNDTIFPHWIVNSNNETTNVFWYERSYQSGKEYRLVDAKNAVNTVAFDHALFASALAKASNQKINAQDLPISHMTITLSPLVVSFNAFDQYWQFISEKEICQKLEVIAVNNNEVLSPNGKRIAFTRDYNLWVRDVATGKERALTLDGEESFSYAGKGLAWGDESSGFPHQPALWSPDSTCLLTVKRDRRQVLSLPVVTHLPLDHSFRPQLKRAKVAYPGDRHVESYQILTINVETADTCYADYHAMPAGRSEYFGFFLGKLASWAKDSRRAYFIDQPQGDQVLRLVEFDTHTGLTRILFEETSETQIDIMPDAMGLPLHQFLPDTNELIWCSERNGWAHLYLYNLTTGALKQTITQGDWRVRDILLVDEKNRELFVQTSARLAGRDPYYRDICRVHMDTGEITTILSSDHEYIVHYQESLVVVIQKISGQITKAASGVSPDGRYIVATRTRADQAPISLLINNEGKTVLEVEETNISALPDTWQWPEPVQMLAADGVTDIYGLVFRPSFFSPDQQYPVINFINSGPWLSVVPKGSFNTSRGYADRHYFYSAAMAELGFIVVNIDSRGSPLRSKRFLDESYGWIPASANTDDHACAIQQLAQRYSYMDINRVGICSQGYRSGLQNFLERQDFYKVCVQIGLLDNRLIGGTIEGDKWEGIKEQNKGKHYYPEQLASNLTGKLMLMQSINSAISVQYPPGGMFRIIDALQKANKTFDMLIVPGDTSPCTNYMFRRGWDYLVKHLLGLTPPKEFYLADVSME